jgi:lipoprotein-releasing system ATP-binding protein
LSYLSIRNLQKSYGKVHAVAGVDLDLIRREQYVILGASGSGKSTLLYLLGGLERADNGHIFLDDQDLTTYSDEELSLFRNRQVGFVFQFHFLLPSMNCMENILLPSKISGKTLKGIKEKVEGLAEELGVTHCLKKYPFELSGGEQQRINIIRALSLEPELLLCDEPTGNLDSENSQKVVTLLKKLAESYGSTLVIVTHDLGIADQFENRIVMRDGVVDSIERGVRAELKTPPSQPAAKPQPASSTVEEDVYPEFEEEKDSVADSWSEPVHQEEKTERPKNSYVGLNPKESESTEELLQKTQDLLKETEKILSDDD